VSRTYKESRPEGTPRLLDKDQTTNNRSQYPKVILGTHVDDLLGIAPTEKDLDALETGMENHVELDKQGRPSNMLGMELHWAEGQVVLTQTRLIESMADQHLNRNHGGRHSLPSDLKAYLQDENTKKDPPPNYQSLIGGLLFIARMTRPEISVHVNLLGRRAKDVSQTHWNTALQVLRYLASTKDGRASVEKIPNDRPLPENIYRRHIWGGRVEVTNRGPDVPGRPAGRMVQLAPGRGNSVSNRGGVYRGLRGGKGCLMGTAIPEGIEPAPETPALHGQRRSIRAEQEPEVCSKEPAHRTPVSLLMPASPL